eukprot:scaffold1.g5503.t1
MARQEYMWGAPHHASWQYAAAEQPAAPLRPIHTSAALQRWTSGLSTPADGTPAYAGPTPTSVFFPGDGQAVFGVKRTRSHDIEAPAPEQAPAPALAPAPAPAIVDSAKALNRLLMRSKSAEELLAAVCEWWTHLDVVNLSCALHRLAALGDEQGDAAAFAQRSVAANTTFQWLLENIEPAAAAPEFGSQCVANILAALAKLQCGSAQLAAALREPLLRCLGATCKAAAAAGGGGRRGGANSGPRDNAVFTAVGLASCLHSLAKDLPNTKALFLEVRHLLLRAVTEAMPFFDAQAVAMVFWAVAEITSATKQREFSLEEDAPGFAACLGSAGRRHAPALNAQALATCVSACGRMRPQLRDPALLQDLCNAAVRRVMERQDRPQPSTIATLFCGLSSLRFSPERTWLPSTHALVSLVPELSVSMLSPDCLRQAKPSELASWVQGAAGLGWEPPPAALAELLAWLMRDEERAAPADRTQPLPTLFLQRFDTHQLVITVTSACTLVGASTAAWQRTPHPPDQAAPVPPRLLAEFFDAVGNVLGMRLGLDAGVDARSLPEAVRLAPEAVGQLLAALAQVPAPGPFPLSACTLDSLAAHTALHSASHTGGSVTAVLAFLAATDGPDSPELPAELLEALADCAEAAACCGEMTLGSLATVVHAAGVLQLGAPSLLGALPGAVRTALVCRTNMGVPPCSPQEAALLAVGVAQLVASGVLETAHVSQDDQCELWSMCCRAVDDVVRYAPPHVPPFGAAQLSMLAEAVKAISMRGGHLPPSVLGLLAPAGPGLRRGQWLQRERPHDWP